MSIAALNIATPGSLANAGLGDNQLRDLKAAIKACFGGVAGPVNAGAGNPLATDVELTALFDRIDAVEASVAAAGVFVPGMIMIWYGTAATIPAGWAQCNGDAFPSVTTPDLTGGRFVRHAGTSYPEGTTGGANTASTNNGTDSGGNTGAAVLTIAQLPSALNGAIGIRVGTFSEGQNHSDTGAVAATNSGSPPYTTAPMTVTGANSEGHTHPLIGGTHAHTVNIEPLHMCLFYICYVGV